MYFLLQATVFFTPIDLSHYLVHKRIRIRLPKSKYFTRYFIFYIKISHYDNKITRKILKEKVLYYSVLDIELLDIEGEYEIFRFLVATRIKLLTSNYSENCYFKSSAKIMQQKI